MLLLVSLWSIVKKFCLMSAEKWIICGYIYQLIEMKETTSKFPIVLQNFICQKHAIMIILQLEKLEKHDIYINLDSLQTKIQT